MKIYVAGKFEERASVKVIQNALRALGHTITFDWTTDEYKSKKPSTEDAISCKKGVLDADLYVGLFVHDNVYKGALVELGVALSEDMPVFIIGHAIDNCLFIHSPNVTQFDKVAHCIRAIGS